MPPPFGVVPRTRKLDCAAELNQDVFSDTTRFNLSSDDNHVCVWKPRGECLNPAFALQRHTTPRAGVMVWNAIDTMPSCKNMSCHSCNGSQDPYFNKAMLGLTRQGCQKAVSILLLPFLGLPEPQMCLESSISCNI
ncbi:uncharacterized protein TNCV_1779141 [Trichonephila clavipes]|nr:uncharacterized protein TNCV_1779141 [Trichonephila clavipes]